jgi:hypothetical protein
MKEIVIISNVCFVAPTNQIIIQDCHGKAKVCQKSLSEFWEYLLIKDLLKSESDRFPSYFDNFWIMMQSDMIFYFLSYSISQKITHLNQFLHEN